MSASLNPEQTQAVETTEGALLVLSGAGTGKTRVLTSRLAYIIENNLAAPWNCLAVTFTNRAAKEMNQRLTDMIGAGAASSVWLGTFHSIGLRILRRHSEVLGFSSNFVVLGEDDQTRLLKNLMLAEGYDTKKHSPDAVLATIQSWKDKGFSPSAVPSNTKGDFLRGGVLALYRLYEARLKEMNAMDFGDLLLLCLELFKAAPEVLKKYQLQFRYIMVDEYQDTNTAQYLWLRLLASGSGNICCVGDDDQSIYSWRGAEINNILQFDHDFKDAKIIRLERNYRSTAHILGAASYLISHNKGRLGKQLYPATAADKSQATASASADLAPKVKIKGVYTGRDEAASVVDVLENSHLSGTPYSHMAILVRTTFQTREFEEAFIANALPYQVIGGAKFYEREEIRDAIAYIRSTVLPSDDMALLRIIGKPRRGIGDASLDLVKDYALKEHLPIFAALKNLTAPDELTLKPAAKRAIATFLKSHELWQDFAKTQNPSSATSAILENSGYIDMLKQSNDIKAEGRLDNLTELLSVLKERFATLPEFLEHVALISDTDDINADDKINIMTLHSAKGLEFDTVILGGWEEGLFPHQRALDEEGERGLEEERRLAYVGLTRAKKEAYIFYAAHRMIYNNWEDCSPSRFLEELPPEHTEIMGVPSFNKLAFSKFSSPAFPFSKGKKSFTPSHSNSRSNPNSNSTFTSRSHSIFTYASTSTSSTNSASASSATFFSNSTATSTASPVLKVGTRVKHNTFGFGIVSKIDGEKLTILFEYVGKKTVLKDYIEIV